jgi:hypothetical protein
MQAPPATFNPLVAHITAGDGSIFQVLNEAGDDWDEAQTAAAYAAYEQSQGVPE